jgi:hypothetical protein
VAQTSDTENIAASSSDLSSLSYGVISVKTFSADIYEKVWDDANS